MTKLSSAERSEVARLAISKEKSVAEIAKQFNISLVTVWNIKQKQTWAEQNNTVTTVLSKAEYKALLRIAICARVTVSAMLRAIIIDAINDESEKQGNNIFS